MIKLLRFSAVAAATALMLAACSGPGTVPDGTVGDASVSDGAPVRIISADEVADAVPRPDPILAAGNKTPYKVLGVKYDILDDFQGYKEQGIASWYGTKFHGRYTSNGEVFDLYQATAAHKSLPIPCYARVTNLDNGRSVVVRVNDRGPFHSDRLIDLSYGAAIKLGYMHLGTARVEVEVIAVAGTDDRRNSEAGSYRYVQLGAFGNASSADALRAELASQVPVPVFVSPVESAGDMLYRVRLGPVNSSDDMKLVQRTLRERGYGEGQLLP